MVDRSSQDLFSDVASEVTRHGLAEHELAACSGISTTAARSVMLGEQGRVYRRTRLLLEAFLARSRKAASRTELTLAPLGGVG